MRPLALALLLILLPVGTPQACGAVLVSGFDDVMRQADNTGLLRAARRLMMSDVGYAGMPELYRIISCARDEPRMYVVSAISTAFAPRARTFLAKAGYPSAELQFRRWLLQWSPERFKRARIERLLRLHAGRHFVIVLDNSATSLALSRDLLRSHPSRVAAIYLRQTVRSEFPAGATPFITAFDIAASEFSAGRITSGDTARVAAAILAEPDASRVVPTYSYCPRQLPSCTLRDPDVMRECERVRVRVEAICRTRSANDDAAR